MAFRSGRSVWSQNPVLRLVVSQAALGAVLGFAFALALVAVDAHGLGTLMLGSDAGLVAFALLAGGFMVTFGSLVAGGALMLLGTRSDEDGDRPGAGRQPQLIPIPVRVTQRRRRM